MPLAASEAEPRSKLTVLVVEDNPSDTELEIAELRRNGFDVQHDVAQTREEVCACLDRCAYDLVVADYNLPHFRGMEAVGIIQDKNLGIPLILVTGALTSVTAVECLKQGATDFVLKEDLTRLSSSVRRALAETLLKPEQARARQRMTEARYRGLGRKRSVPGMTSPSARTLAAHHTSTLSTNPWVGCQTPPACARIELTAR